MTGLDAAVEVLRQAGGPLRVLEITRRALEGGLWESQGKTPADTIGAAIYREIGRLGPASRFRLTARGVFALNDCTAIISAPPSPLARPNTPPKEPRKTLTFLTAENGGMTGMTGLDAALEVLRQAGEPLHFSEIGRRVLADGLWKSQGRTPSATIAAAIYREIADLGPASRFRQAAKGMFAINDCAPINSTPPARLPRPSTAAKEPQQSLMLLTIEILRSIGKPAHFREIVAALNAAGRLHLPVISVDRIRSLVRTTDLFVRVAPGTYGLAEWGLEDKRVYDRRKNGLIGDTIEEFLTARDEPAGVADILAHVMSRKRCRETSVRQSLSCDPRFHRFGRASYGLKRWVM